MKIKFKKEFGQLVPYSEGDKQSLEKLKDGVGYEVDIKNFDMRTLTQNRALHKYFGLLAEELNKGGLSVVKTLKVDVEWTPDSVKELLWRPIMEAVLDKKSTTQLNKDEITKVYDTLNLALSNKFGFSIEFPSKEN